MSKEIIKCLAADETYVRRRMRRVIRQYVLLSGGLVAVAMLSGYLKPDAQFLEIRSEFGDRGFILFMVVTWVLGCVVVPFYMSLAIRWHEPHIAVTRKWVHVKFGIGRTLHINGAESVLLKCDEVRGTWTLSSKIDKTRPITLPVAAFPMLDAFLQYCVTDRDEPERGGDKGGKGQNPSSD